MKRSKRMTLADLELLQHGNKARLSSAASSAPVKTSKYKNEKASSLSGLKFDSKAERNRWDHLCLQLRAGLIKNLRRQVYFELAPAVHLGGKRKKPALRYQADHVYELVPSGELVVEDVKGMKTQVYIIKKHLMATVHGILIKEVR